MRWEEEWKIVQKVDSMDLIEIWLKTLPGMTQGSHMQSCSQNNIGGGRQLRMGGYMTTTMQQLGGSGNIHPKNLSELRLLLRPFLNQD